MRRLTLIGYLLLLALAFLLGLAGTIVASRVVLSRAARQKPALERPVEVPTMTPMKYRAPTVEC
ncbi:MAG: hypothetical protein HY903_23435 [Deltaproteobacteria bacterium]|nr:hypothetical protein [Deltaproteobacteria bacterium]